uniref:Fmp27_GFWDK domain-containing protein n=1 Tax=Caenorhabditis tropicalis TaxID=1561998 RepID=A0A1I7UST1_9PELO
MIVLFTALTLLFILWKYIDFILSRIISLITKWEVRIGGVGFVRLNDVSIRVAWLFIHINVISLRRDPTHPTRFCILRLDDVRIEAEKSPGRPSTERKTRMNEKQWTQRFTRLAQYCGLVINRVHIVVMDTIPECLLHVTIDEWSLETFRSREGWQFETSCSLIQGKLLRRNSRSGSLLAELSMPFQLSLDIDKELIEHVSLRISTPSFAFTDDFLAVIENISSERKKNPPEEIEAKRNWKDVMAESIQVNIDVRSISLKYTVSNGNECRYMTSNIKQIIATRSSLSVTELNIADQLLRSEIRLTSIQLEVQEAMRAGIEGIHAKISFHDVQWWKNMLEKQEAIRKLIESRREKEKKQEDPKNILIEVSDFSCDILDFDYQKSQMKMGFLSFEKAEQQFEIGVELLFFGSTTEAPQFEVHRWGESVFVGAVIVQWKQVDVIDITVGCDDLKFEWSDRLARQIEGIIQGMFGEPKEPSVPSRKKEEAKIIAIQVSANRIAALLDVSNESFAALTSSKLEFITDNWTKDRRLKMELVRGATGIRNGKDHLYLADIFESERIRPQNEEEKRGSPTRRWSQLERERAYREERESREHGPAVKQFISVDTFEVTIDRQAPVIDKISVFTPSELFLAWSPQLHLIFLHAFKSIKKSLKLPSGKPAIRQVPRKKHIILNADEFVEVQIELARNHRMFWQGEKFSLERFENQMRMTSEMLYILLNEQKIISVRNPTITVQNQDEVMSQSRVAFANLASNVNKVWIWAADKFLFRLPFDFNFAEIFTEFSNIIKWIKVVHGIQKSEFTEKSPLPSDVRIEFHEVCLELEDDEFENRLKLAAQLKEDEVYESERREQLLEDRLFNLKKTAPFLSKEMIENMKNLLIQKNSEIYIERWKMTEISDAPLFLSKWKGWSMRAFADISLHGTEKCIQLMKSFDPLSPIPDQKYSTLWARAVEFDVDEWTVTFKDYPMKYLDIKDLHFFGTLVGAESLSEDGRSLRECTIPLPAPFPTHTVQRNMSPLKFYYDLQCASTEYNCTYGPCWEPCLSMISLVWNSISAPSMDPSQPLPFWDKMRFLLHGKLLWSSEKIVTTMLASNDPYNETETVEMLWEDFGLDWALGEIRIKSGLKIFLRTASRYDDSQILSLPDVRLKVLLGWECGGDPHEHHAVQLCAPHRLPHYSSTEEHDSYRQFRSSCVNVTLNFDVSPGSCTSNEKMPNLLLYSNTFRWIEQFLKSLTTKNRNVRRGKVFGNRVLLKPQLSKHFGKLQFSFSLPKVLVTYWMSHSSSYGFRVFSDGLQLTASFRQTVQHSSVNREMNVQRRKVYSWSTHHMTCTWWATQIHVYGGDSRPPSDGSPSEDTFLLGFGRVQYARETFPGKDVPLHKVTAFDLKMAWTAENRDACLTIADGVHRAHMLRRILSNDAVKTLNVHLEETVDPKPKDPTPKKEEKTHRRGYSVTETNPWMLTQLIDEVGTKLVAHCEQASDVPIDSLIGVHQSTMDDVKLLNWQIDLFNSQLVLKGCERDGFLLVCAAKSQLLQNFHRNVWKRSLLLSKKSWSAKLSGMQYFAPISLSSTGANKEKFRWLPREVIDDKTQDTSGFADDFVQKFTATGEAVGGVVQSEVPDSEENIQLQRIVSRCSCQIYFCYFSDELKTDSSEDISVPPQVDPKHQTLDTDAIGIDVLTLKHNMLEATSNSEQYEMVVDIVNNLALFVDPNKKEMGEKRRRLRFECQLMGMAEMRAKIMRYQSELREIVSLGRYLERQLFYLNNNQQQEGTTNEQLVEYTEEQLVQEAEETKQRMLTVSERLATYISSYKQRQVNQVKEYDEKRLYMEVDGERWADCPGADPDSQFLYTRTVRDSNCGDHLFEVGSVRITNLLPDSIYKHALHRDETRHSRQPAIRLYVRDMPPVGGISVKEHFELNIAPMVAEITHRLFDKMMRFFFPGRNVYTNDSLEGDEDNGSTFSFTRKIASTLSMRSNKSASEKLMLQKSLYEKDDIDRMKERADKVNHFMYIKIPEVSFVVSYKGNKDKNLIDVNQFNFIFPLCEYHEQNWTWLDLALAVKQQCKRVLLQQFMRQKLLRNRISNFSIDPIPQGVSEDEKKRIAVGITTSDQKSLKAPK